MYRIETVHDLVEYLMRIPNQNVNIKKALEDISEDIWDKKIELVGEKDENSSKFATM